ncbi:MAG: peroxiredoxin [Candidatus Methylopumilus sp.]|jgi:peroxiredoxin Q/BCP
MKILLLLIAIVALIFLISHQSQAAEIPKLGDKAPDFSLPDQNGQIKKLSDFSGQWVVLYFYPKDDTPGCTKEACSFRDDLASLEKLGAKVLGVSIDNSDSHAKFASKYHLPFSLLADSDGKVAESYGALNNLLVIKIAKRYTFLINPAGKIAKVYLSVDTSRHSQEIIDDLKKNAI